MNKIAFIIPYFGKFNNYFQLFLNSCERNENVTWIIFTDDQTEYKWPNNVKRYLTTFKEIKHRFKSKFDFEISLERPYKLCDFRPTYGYVFEEYLSEYDFWGYCDTDLIWGRIENFISDEMLNDYDKVGIYGHCTLIRNSKECNRLFMKPIGTKVIYKDVLSCDKNCSFDEEFDNSINNIFEEYNKRIFGNLRIANIYMKSSDFCLVNMNSNKEYIKEKKSRNFFLWDNGRILRYVIKNNSYNIDEYMYIHMQSRPMKVSISLNNIYFKIIPNSFDDMEKYPVNKENVYEIKFKHFNLHYFKLRYKNMKIKIRKMIKNEYRKS